MADDDAPEAEVPKAEVSSPKPSFLARMTPKWRIFWLISIISLVADQVTKIWARAALPVHPAGCDVPHDIIIHKCIGMPVKVIDGFWDWRLSMNPGSAFGLFGSLGAGFTRWFLSIIGIAAVIGMIYMLKKARDDQRVLHWALAFVAGGAVGNLIDRVYYSVVTDFILWRYKTHEWPVFNIADVVLVVGVGLMFIDIQKENKREKLAKKNRNERAKAAGLIKK
jgi:signal peptidase II